MGPFKSIENRAERREGQNHAGPLLCAGSVLIKGRAGPLSVIIHFERSFVFRQRFRRDAGKSLDGAQFSLQCA